MKARTEVSYLGAAAVLAFSIAIIFIGYEYAERAWLADTDMRVLHALHIFRGIVSTLIGAGAVVWFLRRHQGEIFPDRIGNAFVREGDSDQIDWFIRLRWLAIGTVAAAVYISQHVLRLLPAETTLPLWLGFGALLATNLFYNRIKDDVQDVRACLLWQTAGDLVILTYLLHFSGGVENPLFVLYVFHVILAGILFTRNDAYRVTAGVMGLFLLLVFLEYSDILAHYPLAVFPHVEAGGATENAAHHLPFILGILGTFSALLAGSVYFTTAIMERLRENQAHLLRTERLSALGQMVAFIAHEINNPIGIISTHMKLLRSEDPEFTSPKFLKETAEIVDRQADRVAKVVHSLLNFSKPHPQSHSRIRLKDAVSEALFIAESRLTREGIKVERSFHHALPRVSAGRNDAVHVFLNLINNAVDAMPGGGTLRIGTRVNDGWVEAFLSDTGEGIAKEDLPKIFDPFFTRKPRERGTGLGLPISLALIKAAGGKIDVESRVGTGTTFTVRYPIPRGGSGFANET